MAATDYGIRLWNAAGQLVFDTTDYSGQWVGTIEVVGTTGFDPIRVIVPNVPDASWVWWYLYYFNAEFQDFEGRAVADARTSFQYNVSRAPSGCTTLIHYGFT